MEKLEHKINVWLQNHLIPKLSELFGERCNSSDISYKITRPRGSFFLSDLFFLDIKYPGGQERRILVKLPSQNVDVIERNGLDKLFANEIMFYKRLAGDNHQDYPRLYLGGKDPTFRYVIVMENVCRRGFFVCPKKINVSLDYIMAGLKAMARLHGDSYAMKIQNPDKLQQIKKGIVTYRYDEETIPHIYIKNLNERMIRLVKSLKKRNYDPKFTKQIEYLLEDVFYRVMMKCVRPVEPLATIVHGDTTINNILFRKLSDSKNEELEAMLIDFALIMYSSPAIDISTLIYMTCSREDIKERTIDLIKYYHDCLTNHLKEKGIQDLSKYTYEAFWQDYKRCAIFGYIIAVYFLAMMTTFESNNDLLQLDFKVLDEINITGGGEALSNMLVDMLIDMREPGLLDYYVNNNNDG